MAYHHGNARDALLRSAADLLERDGAASLSLRQVALAAGLSRQAPYNHFPSKEALLAEVAADGFRDLATHMSKADGTVDAVDALAAAGCAYIDFGIANPARFQLMFGRGLVDLRDYPDAQRAADAAFGVLSAIIARLAPEQLREEARLVAWSLVHGYTELCIQRAIEEHEQQDRRALLFARTVLAMIRSG